MFYTLCGVVNNVFGWLTSENMRARQQFPQRPVDTLHTAFYRRNARLLDVAKARREYLQLVADKGIHIADDAKPLRKNAGALPFVNENDARGRYSEE